VVHAGATPVLVDVDPDTGLIDPAAARAAITPRTKAIIPVHLYGVMADMRALKALADEHGLALIEDAAHCVEAERDGVRPGQLGDAVCYSFYATKNLTCGEGGALGTNRPDIADKALLLRQHGMSKEAAKRYHGHYQHWDMIALGWKYNLNDILASLMVRQLRRLDDLWARRSAVYAMYAEALAGVPGLRLPGLRGKSAHHLFTIQVPADRRDGLLARLGEREIGVAVNYPGHPHPELVPRASRLPAGGLPQRPGLRRGHPEPAVPHPAAPPRRWPRWPRPCGSSWPASAAGVGKRERAGPLSRPFFASAGCGEKARRRRPWTRRPGRSAWRPC